MKSAVIVFPGSNCDRDVAVALELVTGRKPDMVWHKDTALPDGTDFIALPGGFRSEEQRLNSSHVSLSRMPSSA